MFFFKTTLNGFDFFKIKFCPKQRYLLSHEFAMLTTSFNICEKGYIS